LKKDLDSLISYFGEVYREEYSLTSEDVDLILDALVFYKEMQVI